MPSVTPDDSPPPSRRARLRAELTTEIKAVARRQLEHDGPGAVSWRGIARDVGMSPASLYTYFASLDDLYTHLIADSFQSHAAALRRAVDAMEGRTLTDRLFAATIAYREWAIRHPGEFRLIYNNLLPAYEAPEDGPTTAATIAVAEVFLGLLHEGWSRGDIEPASDGPRVDNQRFTDAYGIEISSDELRTAIGAWGIIHGLTSLEVNNQLGHEWLDAFAVFSAQTRALYRSWGLSEPGNDVVATAAAAAAAVD